MHTYSLTVAGLHRELPICKVTEDLHIGAFICFGDAELTVHCRGQEHSPHPRDGTSVRRKEVLHCPQG